MKHKFLFIWAVFFGSFFIYNFLSAESNDIVINEIGAYESSGYEWVEIYNKGDETVNILAWKFWEQSTNHGLSVSTTDAVVDPGEYAVICQDENKFLEKYSGFVGSVFDSSWSTLNEGGEEIGLKDEEGNFVERFTYIGANDFSLERKNPFTNDYTSDNWVEHISDNTVGLINSIFSTGTLLIDPATTTTSTDPGTESPTTTTSIDTSTLWQNIKINEFVCAPEGDENEWVEFFNNNTTSLDLLGGYLCDERGTTSTASCKTINGTVGANSWFLFDLDTRSFLNNDGDSIILRNPAGEEIDKIVYSGELTPKTGQSLARKSDGLDTNNDLDWAITTSLTKNSVNSITAPIISSGGGGGSYTLTTVVEEEEPVLTVQSSDNIIINEIYPDPYGSDTLDEFIELKNTGLQEVNLAGWSIADTVKKYALSGTLAPGQLAVYKREKTGIALNNSTPEEIKLADFSGKIIDSISYKSAPEGQSYVKTVSGTWAWTAEITPGLANKLVIVDTLGITVDIIFPSTAEIGEIVIFNASESIDKRGGQLNFLWNFSDNLTLIGEEVSRAFTTSGVFTAKLTVTSTEGGSVDKVVSITVGNGLGQSNSGVIISEIYPNPEGADKGEFIELYNSGSSTVDLAGWKIKNNSKTFEILVGTIIEPGTFLVFYQNATKLVLNNTADKIMLLDRDANTVDLLKYEKAPSGESYSFYDGAWFWTYEINPGQLVTSEEKEEVRSAVSKSKSISKSYLVKSLTETRESEIKDLVITEGTVAVLPNIFATQYMYIVDGDAGLQIYNFKKDWPELKVGDRIKVKGEISNAQGVQRLKTKTKADFVVLKKDQKINFVSTSIDALIEENLGSLIKITGEITSLKTNYFYLDDGSDEIVVYFKKNTGIEKKEYKIGDVVEVLGIVEAGKTGFQVWPRSSLDIVKVKQTGFLDKEALYSENNSKDKADNYITATLGGFFALFFGFLLKNRGTVIKGAIALAGKLIKRG